MQRCSVFHYIQQILREVSRIESEVVSETEDTQPSQETIKIILDPKSDISLHCMMCTVLGCSRISTVFILYLLSHVLFV